jgi:hypothetical protein
MVMQCVVSMNPAVLPEGTTTGTRTLNQGERKHKRKRPLSLDNGLLWSWREQNPDIKRLIFSYLYFQKFQEFPNCHREMQSIEYQIAFVCTVKVEKFPQITYCISP